RVVQGHAQREILPAWSGPKEAERHQVHDQKRGRSFPVDGLRPCECRYTGLWGRAAYPGRDGHVPLNRISARGRPASYLGHIEGGVRPREGFVRSPVGCVERPRSPAGPAPERQRGFGAPGRTPRRTRWASSEPPLCQRARESGAKMWHTGVPVTRGVFGGPRLWPRPRIRYSRSFMISDTYHLERRLLTRWSWCSSVASPFFWL